MVQLIGLHKKTDVLRLAAYTTIACLVTDMIILPIMIGMNLVEVSDNRISTTVFRGKYTDFSEDWYPDIGRQLLTTMILFTFQPLIDFLIEYLLTLISRAWCRHIRYKNLKRSEQGKLNVQNDYLRFLDLYAGPEYAFYYKVSTTNVAIILIMVLGGSMPLLYVLGTFSLAI